MPYLPTYISACTEKGALGVSESAPGCMFWHGIEFHDDEHDDDDDAGHNDKIETIPKT